MAKEEKVEQVVVEPEIDVNKKDVEEGKALAVISYFWLISLIVLLVKKDNAFVLFHARQGLVLAISATVFSFIPIIGWLLNIVVIIFAVVGIVKALAGETWKMPILGDFAQKIKF